MTTSLHQILRKVVRVDASDAARPPRPWAVADNAAGNCWTIRDGDVQRRFFFVTGCYKSGTHWVQNLLNLHPKVNVKGEFHFQALHSGFLELTRTSWYLSARPRLRPVAEASFQDFIRRMMYMETRDKPGATWLGDRTPRAMGEFLPGAPQINIIRDGRDVMVSWNFQHLRTKTTENLMPQMREIAERCNADFQKNPEPYRRPNVGYMADEWWFRHHARVWGDIVGRDLTDAPELRAQGTTVLQINYEQVHKDLAGSMGRMFELLDLDPAEAAAPSDLTRTLPGFDEDPTKFFRRGAMGEWKDYFTDEQKRWFKEEAGETLIRAGYEKDGNW
jgi:hypothetical protein